MAVLFIPGIKGTELWEGAKKLWPSFKAKNVERLVFNPDGPALDMPDVLRTVTALGGVKTFPVYEPLLSGLANAGLMPDVFPYDWRQDVIDQVPQLIRQIEGMVAVAGAPITLLCHSMGSLLAKACLVQMENPQRYVGQVITLGAPWHGAPQALRILMYGEMWPDEKYLHYYAAAFSHFSMPATPMLFRDVARSCPAVYQLLPNAQYHRMCPFGGILVRGNTGGPLSADNLQAYLDDDEEAGFGGSLYSRYAIPFHREMAKPWPAGIPHYALVGYGKDTVGQIIEEPQYYLQRYETNKTTSKAAVRFVDGDKTVPLLSAVPPEDHHAVVRYVARDHLQLAQDPSAVEWVRNILSGIPFDAVAGISEEPEQRHITRDIVMVSCPVDVNVNFGDREVRQKQQEYYVESVVPDDVEVYYLGETKYFSIPAGTKYTVDMESFGTGPLNVAVTRYEDTEVVKTSQFKEIMLDPKIVARLEVNRDDGATITVTRSPHDQGAVHRPVVIEGVERLQDRTPPTVQIALEPVGGGPDIGSLWYGKCQLRLNVRDEHNEVLEAYYRVNGSEWSLYQGPTVLDQWGSLVVEAFATDLVRNRSRSLARRSVQLLDPTQHLRVELEYSSARINAYIRTMEGEEPSQNPVIVYALNDEAPRAYSGGAVPIEYGVGDVRFWFQVRELGHPDYGGRSHTVHTSSIQAAIWGNGVRFSSDTLVRLLGEQPGAVPTVYMEEFRVDHEFDIHAYPKVETIRIEYPATTYRVNLRPTYECYIQQDEIVAKGEDVTVEFEMYDHDRQITYPSIHVKLYVKREQRHVFTDKIILPEIGDDGKYRFSLNTVRDLPLGHKVFRLEFCDYRAVLRSRALLLK